MKNAAIAMICAAFVCCSCASTQPQKSARTLYEDYVDACVHEREDKARGMLMTERTDPCPSEVVEREDDVVLVAQREGVRLWRDSRYHILSDDFVPDSPFLALKRFKYAIKNGNSKQLSAVLASQYDDAALNEWLMSALANEIYAGLALSRNPWILVENKKASCEIAGRIIFLDFSEGEWRVSRLPTFED